MIVSLTIGRKGSSGLPGKNTMNLLGHPLCSYSMNAAINSKLIDKHFVSTDDERIASIASDLGVKNIPRPNMLNTKEALGEDVFAFGLEEIEKRVGNVAIELVVLLFCNVATISSELIDEGIKLLRENPNADSAVTVSKYNMWSPLRARKLNQKGFLEPFVPFEVFGDPETLNCDRDSQGDVYFADMGVSVVRPQNLKNLKEGLLPQKWMGRNILPISSDAGFDLDYEWQVPLAEWWLKNKA